MLTTARNSNNMFKRYSEDSTEVSPLVSARVRNASTNSLIYENYEPALANEGYEPPKRHDTVATLACNTDDTGYSKPTAQKKSLGLDVCSSGDSKIILKDVDEESQLSDVDGVLFFPSQNNKAYSLRPISGRFLTEKLNEAIGIIPKGVKKEKSTDDEKEDFSRTKVDFSPLQKRFIITLEIIAAKLFMAGFFWQTGAYLSGASPDSTWYAIATGASEATGVFFGNCIYDVFKKVLVDDSINVTATFHTGILLASATFFSGASWQPVVNTLQALNLEFIEVFWITGICCTYMFNFGLRVARNLYSSKYEHIEEPNFENSRNDFSLSMAIGAATAFFVGTDTVTYTPEQNFLYHVVGVKSDMHPIQGSFFAGCSTALGFAVGQSILNLIYPYGTCWIDL